MPRSGNPYVPPSHVYTAELAGAPVPHSFIAVVEVSHPHNAAVPRPPSGPLTVCGSFFLHTSVSVRDCSPHHTYNTMLPSLGLSNIRLVRYRCMALSPSLITPLAPFQKEIIKCHSSQVTVVVPFRQGFQASRSRHGGRGIVPGGFGSSSLLLLLRFLELHWFALLA